MGEGILRLRVNRGERRRSLFAPNLLYMRLKSRPVDKPITPRYRTLCVGEFPLRSLPLEHSQDVHGLFLEMVQVWVSRQVLRHLSPFVARCPRSGLKELMHSLNYKQVGYSLTADRVQPVTAGQDCHKNLHGATIRKPRATIR